jgi:tRNA (mo5U34)-methyltransferase
MLTKTEAQRLVDSIAIWHHVIEFPQGVRSPGAYDPAGLFERLGLGELHGKRVLDVGTRDGFFAFECERRGAQVVAIDNFPVEHTGFEVARRILGSSVEYQLANVYDLKPEELGHFDIVLFLGVIYHLRHPLLALDRLRAVCRGTIYVESLVSDGGVFLEFELAETLEAIAPKLVDIPIAQFLPRGRFHRDWTNKWVPNVACLEALVEDAIFAPEETQTWGSRALVRAVATEEYARRVRVEQDRGTG